MGQEVTRVDEWVEAEGVAALDHYGDSGERADLRVADHVLGRVLAERRDHADRFQWAARLSDAFTERADAEEAIEDYDSAIAWTKLLVLSSSLGV
jgi:hypothetical protein